MKNKVVIVILALVTVGLIIALVVIKSQADSRHSADVSSITDFSNQVVNAHEQIKELGQVNLSQSNELSTAQHQISVDGDQMSSLSNSLAAANTTLAQTQTTLTNTEELVTNLNTRIADLEAQNKVLDEQSETLSNQLSQLTAVIDETKAQLASSRNNAAFLKVELQKQLAQKAELEHKFNDLAELRDQVHKVKEEMFIARRIELMRNDLGLKKGAELLMIHPKPGQPAGLKTPPPHYDLNVEIGSDGSVKVIPPAGSTNAPAGNTNPPAAASTNTPAH